MSAALSTAEFLGLKTFGDGTSMMPMVDRLMGGGSGSLFGGVGLAAAVLAAEAVSGRAPVWMTGQFVSPLSPPHELVFVAEELVKGRGTSQIRVTGVSDGNTIFTALGATGGRREDHHKVWATAPQAGSPDDFEPLGRTHDGDTLHNHVEIRMVRGMFGFSPEDAPGRGTPSGDASTLFWARMPNVAHDAAAISLMADYLPSAVGNAVGERIFCSSLDNTIRFVEPIEIDNTSEWVLCESHVEYVASGFASSRGFMWSRGGKLLASANQSMTASRPRE